MTDLKLYNRMDCCYIRERYLIIFGSLDGANYYQIGSVNDDVLMIYHINLGASSRYVRIQQVNIFDDVMQFCEIELWGYKI